MSKFPTCDFRKLVRDQSGLELLDEMASVGLLLCGKLPRKTDGTIDVENFDLDTREYLGMEDRQRPVGLA